MNGPKRNKVGEVTGQLGDNFPNTDRRLVQAEVKIGEFTDLLKEILQELKEKGLRLISLDRYLSR